MRGAGGKDFADVLIHLRTPSSTGAERLTRCFGRTQRKFGVSCRKVFWEFKGGFFQKAPFCARLRRAIESVCSPPECLYGIFFLPTRGIAPCPFSFVPEHPVNQSPSFVGASFSPRRHTTLSAYKICPRSCYLPEAKNILPTVLRSFSLCEKPNGFGLPGALSKEKEELWNLIK